MSNKKDEKLEKQYNSLIKKLENRKKINFQDFLQIRNFKSQIPVGFDKKKIETTIQIALKLANSSNKEDNKLAFKKLYSLTGVGIPIASAILHFVYPNKYAILDRYCWREAREHRKLSTFIGYNSEFAINNYFSYLDIIKSESKKSHKSLRDIEYSWFVKWRNKKKKTLK